MKKAAPMLMLLLALTMPVAGQPTVSVMYFEDLEAGARSPLSKALAEMLIVDLSRVRGLVVVERQGLEKLLKEMELGLSGLLDESRSPRIGKLLGARYLLLGSFLVREPEARISYRIVEVESGAVREAGLVEGKAADFGGLQRSLSRSVIAAFKKAFPEIEPPLTGTGPGPSLPLVQVKELGTALDYEDQAEFARALEILSRLLQERPEQDLLRAELARVEARMREYDRLREKALEEEAAKPADWNSFQRTTSALASSMRFSALLDYCERLESHPPLEPAGSPVSSRELLDYYRVYALFMLKRWERLIPAGERFLSSHPDSPYYASVEGYTASGIEELKSLEARRRRVAERVASLKRELEQSSPQGRDMLLFRLGSEHLQERLYREAQGFLRRVDVKGLEAKGVGGDTLLYLLFQCAHGLLDKEEAEKSLKAVEAFYPDSNLLPAMRSLMRFFPE